MKFIFAAAFLLSIVSMSQASLFYTVTCSSEAAQKECSNFLSSFNARALDFHLANREANTAVTVISNGATCADIDTTFKSEAVKVCNENCKFASLPKRRSKLVYSTSDL
jgi:hypothetical protein